MNQKADLRKAMLGEAKTAPRRSRVRQDKVMESPAARADGSGTKRYVQPGRQGKKPITGFFPPSVRKQLKLMTVEQDTTIQDLMGEAFNDLFAKYGKPEIAPTGESA